MTTIKARVCVLCEEGSAMTSWNLEAEQAVLGALMVNPARLAEVSDLLKPQHFYRAAHQTVYEALLALAARRVRFDPLTVRNELAVAKRLDACGGASYIASLTDGVPSTTNVEFYARTVADHHARRSLAQACGLIAQGARELESAAEAVALAEVTIAAVAAETVTGADDLVDAGGLMDAAMPMLDRVASTGAAIVGVSTGLTDLDAKTRGLHSGQLVVVAARPGVGKSALAVNIARHAARTMTVVVFSLEMARDELGMRLVISESRQDGHKLQSGTMPQAGWAHIGVAMASVRESARLVVDDAPHRTVSQVRTLTRQLQAQRRDVGLVVIDYLGLLTPDRRRKEDKRNLELADMTRALKLLAKELRLPILLLAQLNREPEMRAAKSRPKLSDLAESGATEKDADQVWFIHQPNEDDTEIIVAKNRSGPKGIVRVAYFEEQYRFANLTEATE